MRFVSVRELSTRPGEIWKMAKETDLVITSNGKPVAVLSGVTEATLEKSLAAIRRGRALIALDEMQKKSLKAGLDRLSESRIETEIRAARRGRGK